MVDFNNPIVIDMDFGEYAASTKHVISRMPLNPFFEQWQSPSSGMPWLASTCESA